MRELLYILLMNAVVMYLVISNIMIDNESHIYNHLNKVYMTILMLGFMGFFDSLFMKEVNIVITFIFIGLIAGSIYMIRTQTLVKDKEFLKSMIEHHSSAVLMSKRILEKTKDQRITQLANNIISSQTDEIKKMKDLIQE